MLAPQVLRALTKELAELQGSEEIRDLGIRVAINEADVTDITAELDGPPGTPYEGGLFRMRLLLPPDFPASPPKGFFSTKIWHPNVAKSGEICVNVLKRDWAPDLGLRHVLCVVRCLLIEPYPESALNEEAGKALLEDYGAYARHARLMTSLHAARPASAAAAAAAAPGKRPLGGQQQQQQLAAQDGGGGQQQQQQQQHGPLTGSSTANAADGGGGTASSAGGGAAGGSSPPLVKKARPEQQAGGRSLAASKVKKSLKRL